MKTHANEPTEIALQPCFQLCWIYRYVAPLRQGKPGAIFLKKILLSCPFSTAFLEDKNINVSTEPLIQGAFSTKNHLTSTRIKSDAIATIGASAWSIHARQVRRNSGDATEKIDETAWSNARLKTGAHPSDPVHLPSWPPDCRRPSL